MEEESCLSLFKGGCIEARSPWKKSFPPSSSTGKARPPVWKTEPEYSVFGQNLATTCILHTVLRENTRFLIRIPDETFRYTKYVVFCDFQYFVHPLGPSCVMRRVACRQQSRKEWKEATYFGRLFPPPCLIPASFRESWVRDSCGSIQQVFPLAYLHLRFWWGKKVSFWMGWKFYHEAHHTEKQNNVFKIGKSNTAGYLWHSLV